MGKKKRIRSLMAIIVLSVSMILSTFVYPQGSVKRAKAAINELSGAFTGDTAKDATGNVSAASAIVGATTDQGTNTNVLSAPTGLSEVVVTGSAISFTRDASIDDVGITAYEIYYNHKLADTVNATSYIDTDAKEDEAYQFYIVEKDSVIEANCVVVSGSVITGDIQWDKSNVNYLVQGDVTFNRVATLTTMTNDESVYGCKGQNEETDFYCLNTRMYNPVTASFVQEDTFEGDLNNSLSLNLYYHNNPIKHTDPTGQVKTAEGTESNNKTIFDLFTGIIKTMFEGMGSTSYNITLKVVLDKQMKQSPQIVKNGRWVNARRYEVLRYLDPNNYNKGIYKYQFLDLSVLAGISEEDMTNYLAGKGILAGKARIYLEAARKYNVNEVYLAAHSSLETGYGTSTLAKGVVVHGVKVYNMYGIGAQDSDPIGTGGHYAYKMGWTTPEKAIEGGAKWISEQYINNTLYKQNTLYKMRWNPASPGDHMYATDIGWAVKQTPNIKKMYDDFQYVSLRFDIPLYK